MVRARSVLAAAQAQGNEALAPQVLRSYRGCCEASVQYQHPLASSTSALLTTPSTVLPGPTCGDAKDMALARVPATYRQPTPMPSDAKRSRSRRLVR
jgi:hypothetical protein